MYLSTSNGLSPGSRISHVRVKLKKKKNFLMKWATNLISRIIQPTSQVCSEAAQHLTQIYSILQFLNKYSMEESYRQKLIIFSKE